MSRARDQVWLFHSVQRHDLSPEDLRWRLLNFFYGRGLDPEDSERIDRLEREARRSPRHPGEQPDPYDSWFEVDVALELLRRTYRVRPQWKVAEKRIDLVVEGLENRLAVECYGDAWHGPEQYEHDMERQRQLERAGWTFVVIRESEFYADRNRAIQQIMEECQRVGIRPANQHQVPASQDSTMEAATVSARIKIADDADLVRQPVAEAEGAAAPEDESMSESGPFTGYSAECGFPDPREASPAKVRVALRQIIDKDGPVTRVSVYQLYVEGCPDLRRVGKAVRHALNRALGTMLRSGEIVQEDELGDGSPEGLVVRVAGTPKVLERPAGWRDLSKIPPRELFLVLDRIRASSTSAVHDDKTLARALLEHYGFTRLTEVRRNHLARILDVQNRQRQESQSGMAAYDGKAV